MNLELAIPGDPTGIEWLADSLEATSQHLSATTARVSESAFSATQGWYGDAADAYRTRVSTVQVAQLPVNDYLLNSIQVLRAYAQRLRWGREYFDEILFSAADVGLFVSGTTIAYPVTTLTHCPYPSPLPAYTVEPHYAYATGSRAYRNRAHISPEMNEWQRYQRLVDAFNEASAKVGAWEGELKAWIANHMAPLVAEITELSNIAGEFSSLREGSEVAIDSALSASGTRFRLELDQLRLEQDGYSKIAVEATESARIGNPSHLNAYQELAPEGTGVKIAGLEANISKVTNYTRILRGTGVVADLAFAAYDISSGVPESTVLARVVGGVVGTGGGSALAAGVSGAAALPTAIVVTSYVTAQSAGWLWETQVDLDTREAVSHWLRQNVLWNSDSGTLVAGQ